MEIDHSKHSRFFFFLIFILNSSYIFTEVSQEALVLFSRVGVYSLTIIDKFKPLESHFLKLTLLLSPSVSFRARSIPFTLLLVRAE